MEELLTKLLVEQQKTNQLLEEHKLAQKDYLSLEEAAILISVAVPTLRVWIDTGQINKYQPSGKLIWLKKSDLIAFIESGKKNAILDALKPRKTNKVRLN
ncbi:helix-turn-helix domain-containing protein [Xanthocytophaga agilis]|uniref:Helix-turn-helix domain-containing protein n=1 Tax=Xanthocytophaga agilis TaxID=3048010 RepID=A0AAE3R4T9_9BACT|nr:helix-turn-helix domain-containing protein [Xanthocytophaga agilis]MDJ1500677.1 helix-turn-helix domain-containing protein [Xanthocytophaga agilis]